MILTVSNKGSRDERYQYFPLIHFCTMATFIIRRLLLAVLTIWALSVLSFFIIQLPSGDYVDTYIIELIEGGFEKGSDGGRERGPEEDASIGVRPAQAGLRPVCQVGVENFSRWLWPVAGVPKACVRIHLRTPLDDDNSDKHDGALCLGRSLSRSASTRLSGNTALRITQ